MVQIYHICWLFLAQVTPGATGADIATPAAEVAKKQPSLLESLAFFMPAMLVVMFLYFLLMGRPKNKDQVTNQSDNRVLSGFRRSQGFRGNTHFDSVCGY